MAFVSGLFGNVAVNGVNYTFRKWKLTENTKYVERNNFLSQGFDQGVPGFTGATLEAEGPWNVGGMALTCGTTYTFNLFYSAVGSIQVSAMVITLEPDNDAEGSPNVRLTARTNGVFTAATL